MRLRSSSWDDADQFVHGATRAFATSAPPPTQPVTDTWVERAVSAGVLLPVVTALRSAARPVPGPLAAYRITAAARHLSAVDDLSVVGTTLGGMEIPWAVVKGPVLRTIVYTTRTARDYTDLDVLVAPRDIGAAVHALTSVGAELLPADWRHANAARTAEIGLLLPGGTFLDLHWNLVNDSRKRACSALDTETLLARRVVQTPDDGAPLWRLDDLDLVVHVLLHGCLSGADQLRWLLDTQQCVRWLEKQGRTPAELARRARQLGAAYAVLAMLERTAAHVDPEVRRWAASGPKERPWPRVLSAVNLTHPPSATSAGRRTGRDWYAATRATTSQSVRAWMRTAVLSARYARSGWPEVQPRPTDLNDKGFRVWVANSEAESRQRSRPQRR